MKPQFSELPSKPRIFICYPPIITEADGSEENINELIPLMDEIAWQTKVGIIDIHGAFKGKGELIPHDHLQIFDRQSSCHTLRLPNPLMPE